jgi:trk/ktr system potassium uptake protein
MRFKELSRVLGRYFFYLAAILVLPLAVALFYEQAVGLITEAFGITIGVCLLCGTFFHYKGKNSQKDLYRKESILLVVTIWFLTALIGALPFFITQAIQTPLDAYFEAMSALTTTGATILSPEQIETMGKPLLFWRSFMQWLGGMGIVVLFIAVLPALAMGGKFLYENEVAGLSKEGMTPRIKETASLLWKIYLGLTLLQIAMLKLFVPAIPLFEAVTLSLSTLSTGGFITTGGELPSWGAYATYWIVGIFMIAGGINFTLYFHGLKGKFYRLYDPEFFLYLGLLGLGCLLMAIPLFVSHNYPFVEALKEGSFMAISSQTSTGFSVASVETWPQICQLLLLILMFIGGMSGSTTGGIKVMRCFIVLRVIKEKIESLFRPELIRTLKVGTKEISSKTAMTVFTFCGIVVLLVTLGVYLLVLDNLDPFSAFALIGSMINNCGLILNGAHVAGSLAFLSPFSKTVCILWMVLGRLEYLSLLVLLVPSFWLKK